jgi:predicted nucleic-acid-binding protein
MIGLDTNVLVRYITQDDPKQSPEAVRIVESLSADAPGYVTVVTVIELMWVLGSCYAVSHDDLGGVLETLLRTKEIVVAHADTVWKAARMFRQNRAADFADCLIQCLAREARCEYTVTFDRSAAKHCGMHLIA